MLYLIEELPVQAPQNGGPFILTKQSLPELIESLESRARRARFIGSCFIGIGAAIITFRAIQATLRLIKRRRARCVVTQSVYLSELWKRGKHHGDGETSNFCCRLPEEVEYSACLLVA